MFFSMKSVVFLFLFLQIVYSSYYIIDYKQIEHKLPDMSDFKESYTRYTDDIPYERVHLKLKCYVNENSTLIVNETDCNTLIAGLRNDYKPNMNKYSRIYYKSTESEFTVIYINMTIIYIPNLVYSFGITLKPSGVIKITYYNIYTYQQIVEMGYSDKVKNLNNNGDSLYFSGLRSSHLLSSHNSILPYLDFSSEYECRFISNYIPLKLWSNYSEIVFYPISSSWCVLPLNYSDRKEITFVGDYYYYYNYKNNNDKIDENENVIKIKCEIYDKNQKLILSTNAICEIPSLEISNYTVKLLYYDYISKEYQFAGLEYAINLENEDSVNYCDECGVYKGNNSCYGCDHILYNYDCDNICEEDEFHLQATRFGWNCCKYDNLDCFGYCGGDYVYVGEEFKDQNIPCCSKSDIDCGGYCNGKAIVDKCGSCFGGKTGKNTSVDCNNDCFGSAIFNDCGICVLGNTNLSYDYGKDCNGECRGYAYIDNCGYCVSGSTGLAPNFMIGCNNNSCDGSYFNICGYCVGGNTGLEPGYMVSCNNSCDGSYYNECNICVGGNTGLGNDTGKDCYGECNGTAFINSCSFCVGGNTGLSNNTGKDCNGECNGTAFINNCSFCVGGNTGLEPDYMIGCNNNSCDGSFINICGYCVGGNTDIKEDYMIGCNNDSCDGSYYNECDICVGGNTGLDDNEGKDCLGECNGNFYDCDNFTIEFDNDNGEQEDLDSIQLYDGKDIDIYLNGTNELSKNVLFHMAAKMYDYYPDIDMFYYSYNEKKWKNPDRYIEVFKPNDTIQIHIHIYIEIMYKEKRIYRSFGFNSLVLYFSVEGIGPLVEQYINYTLKYIPCEEIKNIYTCNNMPGCFFCLESVGYNLATNGEKLDVGGKCIKGDLTSECYEKIKTDYSPPRFTFSFLLVFIIGVICM